MKRKSLIMGIGLALLLGFTTTSAHAQIYNPLAFGALGTALGFAAGGNAASAAIGGAAGVGAGILLNATAANSYYDGPYYPSRVSYPSYGYRTYYPTYGYYNTYYPGYAYYRTGYRPHSYGPPRHHDRWASSYALRGWHPRNQHARTWHTTRAN